MDNQTTSQESLTINDAAAALEQLLPEEGEQEETAPEDAEVEASESESDDEPEGESDDEGESEVDEESEEGSEQPQTVTVKVNGQEIEVTLDELKSGYSRTQDYTRKTQEIAQARQEMQAEFQNLQAERQQYQRFVQAYAQQMQESLGQEPDWELLKATDPIEYGLQWTDWQRKREKLAVAAQEQQRIAQLTAVEQQKQLANHLQSQRGQLLQMIPEWQDSEKAKAEKALILEFGKRTGYTEEELGQVYDSRAVVTMRKAALYDQMMEKAAKAKPVQSKTVKPGSQTKDTGSDAKRAQRRFAQTKSVKDAATAIEFLLR